MPPFVKLPKMSVADAKAYLEEMKDPEKRYMIDNPMEEYQRRHKILKAAEIREAQEHFKAVQKEERVKARTLAKKAKETA